MADAAAVTAISADVAKPSEAHHELMRLIEPIRALMGGTHAMRGMREKYLPREKGEDEEPYNNRIKRSVLFGALAKTVEDMTGKIFAKPILLKDSVPEQIQEWCENVDNAGRHLNVFACDVFFEGMQAGVTYILTEMPPKVERPDGKPATMQDEQDAGIRPYLVHVKIENLLGWKSQIVNGRETLTMVRIRECIVEDDGEFGEKKVDQIRVLEPGKWRTYRKTGTINDKNQEEWALYASGETSVDKITLTPVYFRRTDFMTGKPPLEKLAELNIQHWQSSSDQNNILHVARVPILFGAGFQEGDQLVVGAGTMAQSTNPNAKLEYVEHSGQAIDAGQTQLDKLEFQMQVMGLTLITPQPGGQSATGALLDHDKENSPLAMMATALQDAIEQSFGHMAAYAGIEATAAENGDGDGLAAGGEVEVNKDFGAVAGRTDLQQIVAAYVAGAISRQTVWDEMQRRNFLSDSFDPEAEAERIETEHASLLPPNQPRNSDGSVIQQLNPGLPNQSNA